MKKVTICPVGKAHHLLLDGKPDILLAGELHNSSSSSPEYMKPIWGRLAKLGCDTVISALSWELIEPQEGVFDFTTLDAMVADARQAGLKLVLLWFGSWKNSRTNYAPEWVKRDTVRFPRALDPSRRPLTVVSCYGTDALEADAKAYCAMLQRLTEIDTDGTVIAIQIENEVGLLGSDMDYSPAALKAFAKRVPADLAARLRADFERLDPDLKRCCSRSGLSGSWEKAFGRMAKEAFMAYSYATFINELARRGKQICDLPMYVNTWTIQYDDEPAGSYPCGGPVSKVHDIWRFAAPDIDFLAPDIYRLCFEQECAPYMRNGNPLFIPEVRRDKWGVANTYTAIGKFHALCYAPFGIDSVANSATVNIINSVQESCAAMESTPIADMLQAVYRQLASLKPLLLQHYGCDTLTGFTQYNDTAISVTSGGFQFRIRFNQPLDKAEFPAAGLIVTLDDGEYLFAGYGYSVEFLRAENGDRYMEYGSVDEGVYENGTFRRGRRLNGDELGVSLGKEPCLRLVRVFSFD
ncbi:MAG: DUF5597 domain-containing protein [Clostridia bacterium]|nr:DUF5597 domain-containing protein [Clostridia bacterium]